MEEAIREILITGDYMGVRDSMIDKIWKLYQLELEGFPVGNEFNALNILGEKNEEKD